MTDQQLLASFVDCSLSTDEFSHDVHVRLAWLHLRNDEIHEALSQFRVRLKRFTTAHGRPNQYHETITVAFMLIIQQRMAAAESMQDWRDFAAENADLLDWKSPVLKQFYDRETLMSDVARHQFVGPDHGELNWPVTTESLGEAQLATLDSLFATCP